jgi:hypothetical protein
MTNYFHLFNVDKFHSISFPHVQYIFPNTETSFLQGLQESNLTSPIHSFVHRLEKLNEMVHVYVELDHYP